MGTAVYDKEWIRLVSLVSKVKHSHLLERQSVWAWKVGEKSEGENYLSPEGFF